MFSGSSSIRSSSNDSTRLTSRFGDSADQLIQHVDAQMRFAHPWIETEKRDVGLLIIWMDADDLLVAPDGISPVQSLLIQVGDVMQDARAPFRFIAGMRRQIQRRFVGFPRFIHLRQLIISIGHLELLRHRLLEALLLQI